MSLRVASFVSNVIMEYFPAKGKEITNEPVCHPLTAGFLAMILQVTSPNRHEIHLLFFTVFFPDIYKSLKTPQKFIYDEKQLSNPFHNFPNNTHHMFHSQNIVIMSSRRI